MESFVEIKVTFQGIEHSESVENYANKKNEKIEELLKQQNTPHIYEYHIHKFTHKSYYEVSLHVRVQAFSLDTKLEGDDVYVALDEVVDKMIVLVKKEKEKQRDSHRKDNDNKRNIE
jgi:ribosomal subunit interface protein